MRTTSPSYHTLRRRVHNGRSCGKLKHVSCRPPGAGLYRVEIAAGPGSGAKVLNHPVPPAFRESVKARSRHKSTS